MFHFPQHGEKNTPGGLFQPQVAHANSFVPGPAVINTHTTSSNVTQSCNGIRELAAAWLRGCAESGWSGATLDSTAPRLRPPLHWCEVRPSAGHSCTIKGRDAVAPASQLICQSVDPYYRVSYYLILVTGPLLLLWLLRAPYRIRKETQNQPE